MKRLTAILLCTLAYGAATAADGWDAPADQHVNALRRLPARATSYSYKTPQDALAGDRAQSRMMRKTPPKAPKGSGNRAPTSETGTR